MIESYRQYIKLKQRGGWGRQGTCVSTVQRTAFRTDGFTGISMVSKYGVTVRMEVQQTVVSVRVREAAGSNPAAPTEAQKSNSSKVDNINQ